MKNMSKKIVAILLTMCIILSGMVTAFATTNASDPAYKMLFDKDEIFRTTSISTSQAVTFSFDYYLADGGIHVDDTAVSGYTTALKAGAVSSFSLTVPSSSTAHSFRLTAKTATAELYIWNVKITKSDSTEITFENRTDRTNCEFTEITYADIPEMIEKNYVLLVDTTSKADDGVDNKSFWFNNLGMLSYGDLPNGEYTVQFDVCPIKLAESGSKFHFRTGNGSGASSDAGFWKPELTVGEWTTTSSTFTVTDDTTTGNHILFVYGGFKGYVDNLVILDSEGNEVAGTYTDMGGLSVPSDYADYLTFDYFVVENEPEVELSDDYAIYQDSSAATTNYDTYFHCYDYSTYNDAAKEVPVGEYTVTMDVYTTSIGDLVYKPITGSWGNADTQKTWTPTSEDLNKWVTVTYTGTTTDIAKLHTIIYCAGFAGYVDNITVTAGSTQLYQLSFAESDLGKKGHDSNETGYVVALPKNIADAKPTEEPAPTGDYVVLLDNSANDGFGQFYLHELGMPYDNTYPIGDYTVKFDYYPLVNGSSKNIVAHLTATGWSGDAFPGTNGQKWVEVTEKLGEWQTISFDITTIAEGQFPWFYIGAGMKGYFDNYQIIDKATGETVLDFSPRLADVGKTSKDTATVVEFVEPDCVVLLDNSANDGFGQFYLHELGMPHDKTYPIGDYTVKFDYYPIVNGSSKNIVAHLTATGWSGDAFPGTNGQKWVEVTEKLGEWQTISFDITTIAEGQFPWFYIGAGMKGYFDNYQIIDKATGETVLDFSPKASDLGKISKDISTVVIFEEVHFHTPGEMVVENTVAADCVTNGSHDEVVYCTVCDAEISRNTVTDTAPGHQFTTVPEQPSTDCLTHGVAEHKHCSVCGYDYATGASSTEPFENALTAEDLQLPVADHTELKDNGETVYAMTESGHAKVCAVCDEEFDFNGHTGDFVPNGASGHTGECTVCGLELSAESGHNFNGDNVCDECDWTCTSHNFVDGDVINAGDCTTDKVVATYCTICGIAGENNVTTAPGHTPGTAVRENEVETSCKAPGSYDEVVYCTVETCKAELSRVNKPIDQLPHTPGTPVRENEVGASCTAPGSYDEVVYCTVETCKAELSRENKTIDQLAHTPGTPVRENEVGASCTAPGSYDEVVYCTVENCKAELSRVNKPIDQLPHTPGSSWEENRVNDCINGNSYEIVTNCGVCFEEISRVEHTDEATGHDIYDYDEVSATCSWEGWNAHSQCLICGKHFEFGTTDKFSEDYISEEEVYTDVVADAHSWVEVESIAPDYENEGKIGYKYCEYCDKFVYGDKELDLEIDYDALHEEIDPLLNDAYDALWEEFTAENPEPDENASDEEWNEYYAAFEELWMPVHDSIYMPAYIEALEAAAAAEGVEFEVAVLEKEDDNKDDSDADADNKQDGDTTDSTDDKTDNGSEDKVDGDKSETSPITGEKFAVVVAALTAVIAAGFVLVFKAKKVY